MKKLITFSIVTVMVITAMLSFNSCSEKKDIESEELDLELYTGDNIDEDAILTEVYKSDESNLKCGGFLDICGEIKFYPLIASKRYYVGALIVYNDENNLYVTYWSGWWKKLTDFHLFVGTQEDLPLTKSGNPKFGAFPYTDETSFTGFKTFVIPLDEIPECPIIVAHAVLCDHTVIAFSGNSFYGSRWGWIIDDFCVDPCEEEKEIVTAVKVQTGDPALADPAPQSWAVSGGEGSEGSNIGIGINEYIYNEDNIYPLNKEGDPNDCIGTVTVTDYWENQVRYLEVVIDTYDDALFFYNSYLYAGSEEVYYEEYVIDNGDGTTDSKFFEFPFVRYGESGIRVFKIPFDDLIE